MPTQLSILNAARINAIIQALQDVREMPRELTFLSRTPIVPAVDAEVMARYVGRVQVADMVADDQKAAVYSSGKFTFESTNIPNLKVGANISQEMLNQLDAFTRNQGNVRGADIWTAYENRTIDGLLLGVRQRMELLIIAMQTDSLTYDRLGIKLSGVGWGMPADLKVTPGTTWDTAGSATPVNDILGVKLTARVRYGINFNRVKMSTTAFRYMIATTEFQAKARQYLAPNVSYSNLALANLEQQIVIAGNVLGMVVELYDSRFWTQVEDGRLVSFPGLPITKVIIDSTENDNDPNVMDFANAIVTESIVSGIAGGSMMGNLGGPQYGPVAYPTLASVDMNPPGVNMWAVARGFSRKHMLQSTAVLTVGSFVDSIAVGEPFN